MFPSKAEPVTNCNNWGGQSARMGGRREWDGDGESRIRKITARREPRGLQSETDSMG